MRPSAEEPLSLAHDAATTGSSAADVERLVHEIDHACTRFMAELGARSPQEVSRSIDEFARALSLLQELIVAAVLPRARGVEDTPN